MNEEADLNVVDRLSIVISGKHSQQRLIKAHRKTFFILLALAWRQTNPSFTTKIDRKEVGRAHIFDAGQVT